MYLLEVSRTHFGDKSAASIASPYPASIASIPTPCQMVLSDFVYEACDQKTIGCTLAAGL